MFILKKKKKEKKIIVLGRKKLPLRQLSEHTLLVAAVLSKVSASIGTLGTGVINLVVSIMIDTTCGRGLQVQVASPWQENKPRDPKGKRSRPTFVSTTCVFVPRSSAFPSVKWVQAHITTTQRDLEMVPGSLLCQRGGLHPSAPTVTWGGASWASA